MENLRYPGVLPFNSDQTSIFFGRKEDAERIFDMILTQATVVLHAHSGMGKSSVMNAGVIPVIHSYNMQLVEDEIMDIPHLVPVVIRFEGLKAVEKEGVKLEDESIDALVKEVVKGIKQEAKPLAKQIPFLLQKEDDMWYLAKLLQSEGKSLVLIFDQFEIIESYGQKQIKAFRSTLAQLFSKKVPEQYFNYFMEMSPAFRGDEDYFKADEKRVEYNHSSAIINSPLDIKAVFIVREDKLGVMSLMRPEFPGILKNEFLLTALSVPAATSAIKEPAMKKGDFKSSRFRFETNALQKILSGLKNEGTDLIDPMQLQIACKDIERKVIGDNRGEQTLSRDSKSGEVIIKKENIPHFKDVIFNFYHESFEHAKPKSGLSGNQFHFHRRQILEKLIVNGKRIPVYEGIFSDEQKAILKVLGEEGLVRTITGDNMTSYQFCHDRFLIPALDDLERLKTRLDLELSREQTRQIRKLLQRANRYRALTILLSVIVACVTTYFILQSRSDQRRTEALLGTSSLYAAERSYEDGDHARAFNFLDEARRSIGEEEVEKILKGWSLAEYSGVSVQVSANGEVIACRYGNEKVQIFSVKDSIRRNNPSILIPKASSFQLSRDGKLIAIGDASRHTVTLYSLRITLHAIDTSMIKNFSLPPLNGRQKEKWDREFDLRYVRSEYIVGTTDDTVVVLHSNGTQVISARTIYANVVAGSSREIIFAASGETSVVSVDPMLAHFKSHKGNLVTSPAGTFIYEDETAHIREVSDMQKEYTLPNHSHDDHLYQVFETDNQLIFQVFRNSKPIYFEANKLTQNGQGNAVICKRIKAGSELVKTKSGRFFAIDDRTITIDPFHNAQRVTISVSDSVELDRVQFIPSYDESELFCFGWPRLLGSVVLKSAPVFRPLKKRLRVYPSEAQGLFYNIDMLQNDFSGLISVYPLEKDINYWRNYYEKNPDQIFDH